MQWGPVDSTPSPLKDTHTHTQVHRVTLYKCWLCELPPYTSQSPFLNPLCLHLMNIWAPKGHLHPRSQAKICSALTHLQCKREQKCLWIYVWELHLVPRQWKQMLTPKLNIHSPHTDTQTHRHKGTVSALSVALAFYLLLACYMDECRIHTGFWAVFRLFLSTWGVLCMTHRECEECSNCHPKNKNRL